MAHAEVGRKMFEPSFSEGAARRYPAFQSIIIDCTVCQYKLRTSLDLTNHDDDDGASPN